MESIGRIMVAIDFSEYSKDVLIYAAKLAEKVDAVLVLTNVINQRDLKTVEMVHHQINKINVEDYLEKQKLKRIQKIKELVEETVRYPGPGGDGLHLGLAEAQLAEALARRLQDALALALALALAGTLDFSRSFGHFRALGQAAPDLR